MADKGAQTNMKTNSSGTQAETEEEAKTIKSRDQLIEEIRKNNNIEGIQQVIQRPWNRDIYGNTEIIEMGTRPA